uniref:Zinc finger protein 644a n=1 Tax=Hucho hucho TaxID=62062 RepID=A0A4W5NM96_9TELE
MSDLTGIDEEEKDADPVIDPLDLLQDLMRSQTPLFIETLDRPQTSPLGENSSVLDVLSNTNVLSVNGPSLHQAFESDELNSLSTEKEEKSITQLKTVQDIDTTGIWGFDVESSENSMDNYEGPLSWDPQREFMQFLWDNHDDSPMEELPMSDPPPNSQRRRKRKMDMVVMVDPSEELYSDLSLKSTKDVFDEEDLEDPVPINKVQSYKPQSLTRKKAQYPNGTVEAIKQLIFNAPARNPHEKSVAHRLKTLKGKPLTGSGSEEEPLFFPCTKCNINFKEKNHLHRHMRSHTDPPSLINIPKPFICRECGQSFRFRNSLLRHMTIHQERRERLMEEIKGMNELKDEGTDARLQCPQCTFGTNCPNTFVQHAKTHEKDKRYYDCKNCNYMAVTVLELERHMNKEHSLCKNPDETDEPRAFRSKEDDKTPHSYSCNHCSYGTSSKNIFKNHLEIRHNQTYEEYDVFQSRERNEYAQSPSEKHFPIRKPTVVNSFSSELTSKLSVKKMAFRKRTDLPCDSNDISDLFKKDKVVHRAQRGFKSQTTESKLDKSINNLLSRQRRDKQRNEKNDVTTEFFFVECRNGDNDHDFGRTLSGISNGHKHLLASKLENSILNSGCDSSLSEGISADLNSKHVSKLVVEMPVMKKSPSKRKMSTPYRNTVDQDSYLILPKHLQSQKMQNMVEEMEDSDNKDVFQYSDDTTYANNKVLAKSEIKQEKPYIGNSFSRRMSMKGVLGTSEDLFEKGQDRNSQQKPDVKEECIETQVFGENLAPNSVPLSESFLDADSEGGGERKTCPYCPAEFESGVGLSNHVRGHLHRVGLNYNARHVVSREQVASQDRKPRIRRKMGAIRLKKAKKETSSHWHSCPLCGDSFDNKTGLSNHVRGHLKRLGKTIATKSKSPMLLLRELMRDKREFQRALQILGKKRIPSHSRIPSKQVTSNHLTPPKRNPIQNLYNNAKPLVPMYSLSGEPLDKKKAETNLEVKGSLSSALIGILKKRKCQEDSKLRTSSQTARSALAKGVYPLQAYCSCPVLNVSAYDCKQRRQRSRPGSKKKMSPAMPHAPEEMYRLTCRFCDLVFQGPLSVQEDWIKHLQRHIMNASVPHTGAGMREVTSLPRDPSYPTSDRQTTLLATHTAS